MIVISKAGLLFLLACLIQIISTTKKFINPQKPFKPFVSVLSPETMKKFGEDSEKIKTKFLQREKDDIQMRDILSSESVESVILKDDESSSEKVLKEISFSVKCIFIDELKVYDISGLGINYLKTNKRAHNQTINDINIYFNFCYDIKDINGCSQERKQMLAVTDSGNSTECIPLANSINKGNKWSMLEDSNKSTIIQIQLNSDKSYKTYYKLKCNEKEDMKFIEGKSKYMEKNVDEKGELYYETILFFETKEACPQFDFYVVLNFIHDYYYIFAGLLIAFGIFNCILGLRFAKYTSFILTLFGVTIFSLILFQFILPPGCAKWIVWVILAIGIILGCTAGYFVFNNHKKFMAFLVGGLAGFLLGEFLFNLFGNKVKANLTLINILFIVVCIILAIILAFILKDLIIIFATSFIGAYAFIRGISLFAGHFPSEFTIIDLKKQGEDEQIKDLLNWRVYLYLASIVIVCGLSIFAQIKINHGLKDKEEGTPDALDPLNSN